MCLDIHVWPETEFELKVAVLASELENDNKLT